MTTPETPKPKVVIFEDYYSIRMALERYLADTYEVILRWNLSKAQELLRSGLDAKTILAWVVDGNLSEDADDDSEGALLIQAILALDPDAIIVDFSTYQALPNTTHKVGKSARELKILLDSIPAES